MEEELEELLGEFFRYAKVLFVQGITSNESIGTLRQFGGILSLAARDVWLRQGDGASITRRSQARWEQYESSIRTSIEGGTAPHVAIERLFRTRANTVPQTADQLLEMTKRRHHLTGDGGGYTVPVWLSNVIGARQQLRRRVNREAPIMANTFGGIAAFATWSGGEIYRYVASGEAPGESTAEEWGTPVNVGEVAAVLGEVADAFATGSAGPTQGGAARSSVQARRRANPPRTQGTRSRGATRTTARRRNSSPVSETELDVMVAALDGPADVSTPRTFTSRRETWGFVMDALDRRMTVDQRRAVRRLFGQAWKASTTSASARLLRRIWTRSIHPANAQNMRRVQQIMASRPSRNSPEYREAFKIATDTYKAVRKRFWRNVRGDSDAVAMFEEAGLEGFVAGARGAPYYSVDSDGDIYRVGLQIDHGIRRIDDPTKALDPQFLSIITPRENSSIIENIRRHESENQW